MCPPLGALGYPVLLRAAQPRSLVLLAAPRGALGSLPPLDPPCLLGFLVVLCAALVAGVPVLVVLLLLAVLVVGVAASLVLRRMLSCLRRCTLCGSPVLALPRLVPAAPSWSLRSRVRSVLHVWPLRFPALALARSPVSVLVLPRLVPASPPWSLARFRVAFSLSWLRDSLSLALPSSPLPSSSSVSRPTSLSFLSTLASSYSAPDILACHSFPSVVWNSPVVQKTDYRLQQRRYE